MRYKNIEIFAICLLSFMFSGAAACSSSNQVEPGVEEAPREVIKNETGRDGEIKKYILTVSAGKDGRELVSNKQAVVQALRTGGALQVEALDRLPIIMVTGPRKAIDKAMESGLVESVQVDELRKLYK